MNNILFLGYGNLRFFWELFLAGARIMPGVGRVSDMASIFIKVLVVFILLFFATIYNNM